jgi:hypothetical protein
MKKIITTLYISAICIYHLPVLAVFSGPDNDFFRESRANPSSRLPISEKSLKFLANSARIVAQRLLSRSQSDKKGLILLKFAKHLDQDNREVLLLRGKLKFKVKIEPPKKKVTPEDFLKQLVRASSYTYRTNEALGRHFKAVLCQMIRLFEPSNEDAIITLINFEDKGFSTDLNELLSQQLTGTIDVQYDPKDPRYVVSNVKKTLFVPAKQPWTDSWIKVKEGKIIRVRTQQLWSMGFGNRTAFPSCSGSGLENTTIEILLNPSTSKKKKKKTPPKRFQKSMLKGKPGCLLAKIGKKEYVVGSEAIFRAESSGILFFGPFEWGDYSDNIGSLKVTVQVSDK